MLNNIPALPEVVVAGPQQQKYVRIDEGSASSAHGKKREEDDLQQSEFADKHKTGKPIR